MVILLIESDLDVQFFVWKALREDGFTVLNADSGESALELCRSHSGPVDLVLTAMDLPRINGLDLYRTITLNWPEAKGIVMSRQQDAGQQIAQMGLRFLPKPFDAATLRRVVGLNVGLMARRSAAWRDLPHSL